MIMKKVLIAIIFLLSYQNLYSQVFGNIIEENIQSTVLIKIGNESGSGIMVIDSNSIFLITARHVLFKEKTSKVELKQFYFLVEFYAKNLKNDDQNTILIDAKKLLKNKNLTFHKTQDICVVKIAELELPKKPEAKIVNSPVNYLDGVDRLGKSVNYSTFGLVKGKYLKKEELYLGEQVFTIGFPVSLGLKKIPQFDYDRPLLKRCSIAGLSDNYDTYTVDCHVYSGNSGGPVFLERTDFNSYSIKLIGITVEFIPFINETVSKKDLVVQTSSYAVIVPIDFAIELINNMK